VAGELHNPKTILAENWPRPKNKKEVERFLGFTDYHKAFFEEYTQMALPLQVLTGKRKY
jgi:hypothetical protein